MKVNAESPHLQMGEFITPIRKEISETFTPILNTTEPQQVILDEPAQQKEKTPSEKRRIEAARNVKI